MSASPDNDESAVEAVRVLVKAIRVLVKALRVPVKAVKVPVKAVRVLVKAIRVLMKAVSSDRILVVYECTTEKKNTKNILINLNQFLTK